MGGVGGSEATPCKGEPSSCNIWPGAAGAITFYKRIAAICLGRNGRRRVALLLSMLSSLSQQLPEKETRSLRFRLNKTIVKVFMSSGTGCRGLSPGDGAGFTVRMFPQIPKVIPTS